MDKVQKIREQIELVKNRAGVLNSLEPMTFKAIEKVCENLLSFIDSLEE